MFADPLPTHEEKAEIERLAYQGDLLPEVAEFFANCHHDFTEDAVIHGFRKGMRWIGQHRPPGSLLDVGPGTGIFLYLAAEAGWQPFGIDICEESAQKADQEFGLSVDVGEFETHDYALGSFDCITMLDVLEHMLDPLAAIARAHELLAPGGVLYIAVPNQHCLLTVIFDRYIRMHGPWRHYFMDRLYVDPHVFFFNPEALSAALQRAGFEIVGLRAGNVYLGRYRLPLWMRVPLEIVLKAGSFLGMSAKILIIARKPG